MTRFFCTLVSGLSLLAVAGCGSQNQPQTPLTAKGATVTRSSFGQMPDGVAVDLFTLTNSNGVEVRAITYGCIIVSLRVPDRDGRLDDIVLGYDSLDGYLKSSPYFGAVVGRYANRIAGGRFTLDGKAHTLATNNGPNHLHGGVKGFDKVLWQAEEARTTDGVGVTFTYASPDVDQGYPGKLTARVTYTLTGRNELIVEFHAITDKPTPINLAQHSYFNLAGDGKRDVLDHELLINADGFTPVDSTMIPSGAISPVEGTPFDFRTPKKIGARINDNHEQLRNGLGYDHNFVLRRQGDGLVQAARVVEPTTGRELEISTTEPGIQLYTGNFLDGSITGKSGHVYQKRYGFCLETQHYPDSPNKPQFPTTILRPGEEYRSKTTFTFSVR